MYNHCAVSCIGIFLLWWLVASALLWLTWNQVIVAVAKARPAKYWQALLVILTLCVLCAPRMLMHHHSWGHDECPYEHHGLQSESK